MTLDYINIYIQMTSKTFTKEIKKDDKQPQESLKRAESVTKERKEKKKIVKGILKISGKKKSTFVQKSL